MRKFIRYSFKFIGILILISVVCLYVLLFTQTGLKIAYRYSNKILPGQLSIQALSGKLATSFTLKNVRYALDDIEIKIENVTLDWFPSALFHHKLSIKQLSLKNVDIFLFENQRHDNTKSKNWVRYIDIQYADVEKIRIYKNNNLLTQINALSISTTDSELNNFYMQLPKGNIKGQYLLNDLYQFNWKLYASAIEVDTQYLWPHTHSIVSFNLVSNGEWNRKNKNFSTLIENISGKVGGYSLNLSLIHI